jgi:hypothetical protein
MTIGQMPLISAKSHSKTSYILSIFEMNSKIFLHNLKFFRYDNETFRYDNETFRYDRENTVIQEIIDE